MTPEQPDFGESRLRLETIIRLRWVAVVGQTLTVLAVYFGFRFPLPLISCLVVIGLSALLNIYLHANFPRNQRLLSRRAALMLGYDLVQLSALLYLTGGLENPFSLLIVVPIAISASTQPRNITAILVFLAIIAVSILTRLHLPLPWVTGSLGLPPLYIYGMWTALVCCIVFTAVYAYRTAQETREMSNALAATEMLLAHEQQLAALNGLAAAAAHELGTPLGTIALVAKELQHEVPEDSAIRDDIMLLRSQAMRCRDILGRLTQKSSETDNVYSQMSVGHLIEEVIAPHRVLGIEIKVTLLVKGQELEPVFRRDPSIMYALTNIVENAVDYASSIVEITADWDGEEIRLIIRDDGPGIAPSVMGRLGEPYVTTRERSQMPDEDSGMGLGVFIAKTLLERHGATLRLGNRPPPETGAVVKVIWNRAKVAASLA